MRKPKGSGSLLKIKGTRLWYAQWYTREGRQMRVSTKTKVKAAAQQFLNEKVAERDRGVYQAGSSRLHYADLRAALLARYIEKGNKSLLSTASGEDTIVGLPQLDKFFGWPASQGPSASNITTETGRAFVKARQEEPEPPGTAMINRSLQALRGMLRLAHAEGKLGTVPMIRLLAEPRPRKGFLEEPKFDTLLAELPSYLRPLVALLYYGGVRVGEARQITWSQVDLVRRLITLEEGTTKNDEARVIPIHARLAAMLAAIKPKTADALVFDATNLRREWEAACARCGQGTVEELKSDKGNMWRKYRGLTIHDLRRSAVRNLRLAGVPESVAMKISGHKTRAVFDRYNIVSTEDVSHAMRLVEQNGHGKVVDAPVSVSVVKVRRPTPRRPRLTPLKATSGA